MKRYNSFETVYRHIRQYCLSVKSGGSIVVQKEYNQKTVEHQRFIYKRFKQEVQMMFGFDVETNCFLFDQNELKMQGDGKETNKSLCKGVYFNNEASYLAK